MDVTPHLLKKYYEGLATLAEQQAVEQWLGEDQSLLSEPTSSLSLEEKQIRNRIWLQIIEQPCKPLTSRSLITRGAVAASILLLLGYVGLVDQGSVGINNQQRTAQILRVYGLQVAVEPGSQCEIRQGFFQKKPVIEFSGAVSITAQAGDCSQFILEEKNSTVQQEFQLRKGQTFLAMTDDEFQLITATTDELNDEIPRPFSLRLMDRFRL